MNWTVYDDEPYPGPVVGPLPLNEMLSAYVGDIDHYPDKLWSEKELVMMTCEELARLGPLERVYTLDPISVRYKQVHPLFLTMSSSDRINWSYELTLE